jgi:Protein of unknown function/AsmA-like C-terminal region
LAIHFDAVTRARARMALGALLATGAGDRLRGRGLGALASQRLLTWSLSIFGVVAVLGVLTFGALAFRLSQGPIALDSLSASIASSLEERLGGKYSFALGPLFLESGKTGLGLSFQGVVIKESSGRTVLAAPRGEVGLDLLALTAFTVRAKRLELEGVDLGLSLRPNGALSISAGQSSGEGSGISFDLPASTGAGEANASIFATLAESAINAMTNSSLGLERLSIAHGRLTIDDALTGQDTHFDDVSVDFEKLRRASVLRVSARGPSGPWSLTATARVSGAGGLEIEARDLNLPDILVAAGLRTFPFETDMPISFKLDLRLGPERGLSSMEGRFGLGAGYFKLEDPDHQPLLIDEATGGARWDSQNRRLLIENVQIFEGDSHISFSGAISPPSATNLAWTIDFASYDTVFAGERPGEQPIRLDKSLFQARYLPAEKRFILDDFSIAGPEVSAALKAQSTLTEAGPTLKLDLAIGEGPIAVAARLWPSFIVADVRRWCLQNVNGGELQSASVSIDWDAATYTAARQKKAVPRDSVHGSFSVKDASVKLLEGAPPLAGVEGGGSWTGHDLALNAAHGFIDVGPGRRILASDIAFAVPDTTPMPFNPAEASARFQGGVDALFDLVTRDPLKTYLGLPLDLAPPKGRFDGKVTVDLKLSKTARPEDATVRADIALSNLQIDKFLGSERFEQGAMTISLDRKAISITGDGKLFGAPATIDVSKSAAEEGAAQVAFTLDDAARAKKGMNFGSSLAGPVGVRIKSLIGARASGDMELDFARAAFDNPFPGLTKPAGKPAKATLSFKSDSDGLALNNIVFDGAGASLKGSAQLSNDGSLVSAKLLQVRLSPGDDLKAEVAPGDSGLKITVRGASLDARPILKGLFAAGPPSGAKDFDLDLKVASVAGANKQALSQVDLGLSRRDGQTQQFRLNAVLGGGALTARSGEGGSIRVQGADAGALLKFLDFYTRMEKGALDLSMHSNEGQQEGEVAVKDFILRNEPALRQLVAAGQPNGAEGSIDADVAPFQKLTAAFTRTTGRVDLRDSVIYDQQMGLTAKGFIDYAKDRVDISGTYVPAYQVNNLVTHIPVVGTLLGGGAHEGMFAVNYRITGPASAPTLAVNPLSAVTPGILRKMFGAIDGTLPSAEDADQDGATPAPTAPVFPPGR